MWIWRLFKPWLAKNVPYVVLDLVLWSMAFGIVAIFGSPWGYVIGIACALMALGYARLLILTMRFEVKE